MQIRRERCPHRPLSNSSFAASRRGQFGTDRPAVDERPQGVPDNGLWQIPVCRAGQKPSPGGRWIRFRRNRRRMRVSRSDNAGFVQFPLRGFPHPTSLRSATFPQGKALGAPAPLLDKWQFVPGCCRARPMAFRLLPACQSRIVSGHCPRPVLEAGPARPTEELCETLVANRNFSCYNILNFIFRRQKC